MRKLIILFFTFLVAIGSSESLFADKADLKAVEALMGGEVVDMMSDGLLEDDANFTDKEYVEQIKNEPAND